MCIEAFSDYEYPILGHTKRKFTANTFLSRELSWINIVHIVHIEINDCDHI